MADPWLEPWLALLKERAGRDPILEIGCGHGEDTKVLAAAGLNVHAFDLSQAAVVVARLRVPSAVIECRDVRDEFPPQVRGTGAVVASLSLHYFPWAETVQLAERIHATLRPGGVLLCRVNSTQDHNFGASGHPEIEPNFYLVDGNPKRFFDEAAIDALFGDGRWRFLSKKHVVTAKYIRAKAVWEVVLEKPGA